jgi:hypothetical protein
MYNREESSVEVIGRKSGSTAVVIWLLVATTAFLCVAFLFARYRHVQSIRRMRQAIRLAGGIDHRTDIRMIQFRGPEITNANLHAVGWLKETESLEINSTRVTDNGLSAIAEWKDLRWLSLQANPLTDQSLDIIRNFGQLERLELGGTQITDNGLIKLAGLKNLEKLNLSCCTMVTQTGVQRLQTALPNCEIVWSSDPWIPFKDPAE